MITMRFLWTFIWSVLLSEMVIYVNASMNGVTFQVMDGLLAGIIVTIAVFLITAIIPDDPVDVHEH